MLRPRTTSTSSRTSPIVLPESASLAMIMRMQLEPFSLMSTRATLTSAVLKVWERLVPWGGWLGRWEYESFLDVDEPPFVGSVHIGYQKLVPLSGKEQPKAFPAWERLVIWKRRNSENALCAQTPHVNTDVCLRKLEHARIQGAKDAMGNAFNLYLVDYTVGREVFRVLDFEELPEAHQIAGLPPSLTETDAVHRSHPAIN